MKYIITGIGTHSAWYDIKEKLIGLELPEATSVRDNDYGTSTVSIHPSDAIVIPGILYTFHFCNDCTVATKEE